MRKVIYPMTVSLDGFVESADGKLDWGDPSEKLHRYFNDRERMIDLHLYGRRLYELMAAFWPSVEEDPAAPDYVVEYSRIWKQKPKIVFSTKLEQVGWNSRLVRGNVLEEVSRLKAEPGNYMSVGGPGLASSLMQLGLIDEYWLYVRPIILGAGKRMFPPLGERVPLRLLETRRFEEEVVLMRYGTE
ncbi:MAG TPA: dihydrofolate reductase family protein [Anaerolineales bacterium]